MSQTYEADVGDGDIDIFTDLLFDLAMFVRLMGQSPAAVAEMADLVRDRLVVDARLTGDLFGKWAQKPTPLGVQPAPPATQRIY